MIRNVFRPKRKKNGKTVVQRSYRGRYSLEQGGKVREVALHTTHKDVAEEKLRQIIKEEQQAALGLIPSREMREAAEKPYLEHLADFTGDLRARGKTALYIKNVDTRLKRLAKECGWRLLGDVSADSFVAWRGRDHGLSAKTIKMFQDDLRNFFNWLMKHGRWAANPIISVGAVRTRGRSVYNRRPLTEEEISRLLQVAEENRELYMTAIYTGLRRNELKQLVWDDLHLDVAPPFVRARASTTKNGKDASVPIRQEVAEALKKMRAKSTKGTDRVFRVRKGTKQLRNDLKAAGIPAKDEQGRIVDFHSFRHTCGTLLAKSGVHPRTAQEFMRHSDITMTMNYYTHVDQLATAGAVEKLPWLDKAYPHIAPQKSGTEMHCLTPSDTEKETSGVSQGANHETLRHGMTQLVTASLEEEEWWAVLDSNQ